MPRKMVICMNIVLDTNVLVSALWSANSKPAMILNYVLSGRYIPCHDFRIIEEYNCVLHRPKFGFSNWEIEYLLEPILKNGISVIPKALPEVPFTDKSDRKFLEVAKFCGAYLITGNIKYYPADPCVITVSDFYEQYCK